MPNAPDLDIERYFNHLQEIATEDDIVSQDEFRLIQNIMSKLRKYQKMLDKALEDGIISRKEKTELYKFRTDMFGSNLKIVKEDNKVSEDEERILEILQRILDEMRDIEELVESDTKE